MCYTPIMSNQQAEDYLQRAKQARREAERAKDPAIKDGFLKVAEEYERMAKAAFQGATSNFSPSI